MPVYGQVIWIVNNIVDQLFDLFSVFTGSPQGRVRGIMSLLHGQRTDLINNGFTHSNKFKTSVTYGTQPVSLGISMMNNSYHYIFENYFNWWPRDMKNRKDIVRAVQNIFITATHDLSKLSADGVGWLPIVDYIRRGARYWHQPQCHGIFP